MTLVRFNHPGLVNRLANDVYSKNFMDSFLGSASDCNCEHNDVKYYVNEEDAAFTLEMAIPGLTRDDLYVEVENGLLTIKTKERNEEDSRTGFAALEFEKQFKLADKINQEKISAQSKNGILTITLPKIESAVKKPARSIEVA